MANAMHPRELKKMVKVPVETAEDLSKLIRLAAITGRSAFVKYLYEPLDFHGWKRRASNETSRRLMEHIDRSIEDESAVHTVGPLAKRMLSAAMHESLSATGDATLFFLERMQRSAQVSASREAVELVQTLFPALDQFRELRQNRSEQLFAEALESLSRQDIKAAFAPVELGRSRDEVELQREALSLFHRIKFAVKSDDFFRCRKLIARYLIRFGDQEENNRDEVERLIDALTRREPDFRKQLQDQIATNLFFDIQKSISEGDIRRTIIGIRKYAHIFQGNPEIRRFHEIDSLEQKLYAIITKRDMWAELKKRD